MSLYIPWHNVLFAMEKTMDYFYNCYQTQR